MISMKWLPKPINGNDDLGMEAPLKEKDIKEILMYYGGTIEDNRASFFKKENINKWSKHKPIDTGYNAIKSTFVRFDDPIWNKQSGELPKVNIGHDANANQELLAEVWNGCSEEECFVYNPPIGGSLQPKRMGDFRGYRADATSPFKSFTCDSTEFEPTEGTANFTLNMRFHLNDEFEETEGGMIALTDFKTFNSNEIFTMVIVTKNKNGEYAVWDDNSTIGSGSWGEINTTIKIGTINSLNEGNYECAVALRDTGGIYYKLPFEHILLKAEVYASHDRLYPDITGNVYLNLDGSNSFINLNVDYQLGKFDENDVLRTEPEDRIVQFYIGASENDCSTIFAGPTITKTLEPGERATFSTTVKESEYSQFSQIKDVLLSCMEQGVVWVTANGQYPTPINFVEQIDESEIILE